MTIEEFVTLIEAASESLSPVYVAEVKRLRDLIPEADEPFNDGRLCRTNAYALAKKPPERQRELLDKAISMVSSAFVPMASH